MRETFPFFLFIGLAGMVVCMLNVGKKYDIEKRKVLIAAIYMTATGTFATYILFLIETGHWGGRSFFGAAFFVPVFMYPAAKVLKIKYGELMDICAPAGCIMLSILKFNCYLDGCCYGRLFVVNGTELRFPSQIVECIMALALAAVVLSIINRGKYKRMVYPILMIMYGAMRTVLNLLRETNPWLGPIPAGNVWSALSIIIGIIVLGRDKKQKKHKVNQI